MQVLMSFIDIGLKASGASAARNAVYFMDKLEKAAKEHAEASAKDTADEPFADPSDELFDSPES